MKIRKFNKAQEMTLERTIVGAGILIAGAFAMFEFNNTAIVVSLFTNWFWLMEV